MIKARYLTVLAVSAFLMHGIWENAQAPLYAGYQSFPQHFPLCLVGTLGDVVITLSVLAFLWLLNKKELTHPLDFLALAILGFFIAVIIEQHALLTGTWNYAPAMTIIPPLGVGLIPLFQMTILLPLSFAAAQAVKK